MSLNALVIDSSDNVANLVGRGEEGQQVECQLEGEESRTVTLKDDVPLYHTFALVDIEEGEPVMKYGYQIGKATEHIEQGRHVHAHNIESLRGRGDLQE